MGFTRQTVITRRKKKGSKIEISFQDSNRDIMQLARDVEREIKKVEF